MQNVKFSELTAADRRLVEQAMAVREKAYAPFSKYKCGAAVRDIRNRIHVGCNVETLDMTLTTHA
ncbi:MAG: cytidine deaminase, partial [Kiritimatiellae bacterium]|nr:cytidine deaminase [Kiritimatiellia bacterium]